MQLKQKQQPHKKPSAKKQPLKTSARKLTTQRKMPSAAVGVAKKQTPFVRSMRKFSALNTPGSIFYTKDHEYIKMDTATTAFVGISHHAQEALGDIVYVDLGSPGSAVEKAGRFASVESVKASSDVFAPVAFNILKINSELESNSALVNESPEENGWFAVVEVQDPAQLGDLMNKDQYSEYLKTCDH